MEKTPWHIWVVGAVALIWNAGGAYDYVMTQTRNEAYLAAFSEQQLEYFHGFPTWTVAAWAVAVWFAVLAAILILFRSRLAVPAMALSFIGMLLTTVQNFVLSDVKMTEIMGPTAAIFSAVIVIVTILLMWYVVVQARAGRLR